MTKTIAVTGASGFVGGHLLSAFKEEGFRVVALARHPEKLAGAALDQIVQGDLSDDAALRDLVRDADVVVHAAGAIAARRRRDFFEINTEGSRRVLAAVREAGGAPTVFLSSLAAREPNLSSYAKSKAEAEDLFLSCPEIPSIILRPPAVYGPGDKATLPFFQQAKSGRLFLPVTLGGRFSLIFVEDLARLVTFCCKRLPESNEPIECADGMEKGYSWSDFTAVATEVIGRPVDLKVLGKSLSFPAVGMVQLGALLLGRIPPLSLDKLQELYHPDWVAHDEIVATQWDWRPEVQLKEGFSRTWLWYKHSGWV